MNQDSSIIVTGAAGFIGSYMVGYLNSKGYENLILIDEFDKDEPASPAGRKELNLHGKKYLVRVERDNLFEWLNIENPAIDFVFHLGARTDTTEFDYSIHEKLNVEYSKSIWNWCTKKNIPLVYASSAATYGGGELGYKDDHGIIEKLQPLNAYAIFNSIQLQPKIEYIDTPADIRDKYQYFTEADMTKLRQSGYKEEFYSLEEGVKKYVTNFLVEKKYY